MVVAAMASHCTHVSWQSGNISSTSTAKRNADIRRPLSASPCAGRVSKSSTAIQGGMPLRLVLWHLDSRLQLQDACIILYGQKRRSLLVCRAGAQNVWTITVFKSPWPIPSLSVLLSSRGGSSSGQIRCSSSSDWKSSLQSNANASGEPGTSEQLWEEYFADPSRWWDNRVDKRNPRSPDFKHKVTRKKLWVDCFSTPPWVKARLKTQSHAGHRSRDTRDTTRWIRLSKDNNEDRNTLPTSARELRQILQSDFGMHIHSATAVSEAIAIQESRIQQGINTMDSYTYVEILKWCFKQRHLVAAKQVHDCIIKSRMEQNILVANNLLSVYIRCGRLQDARRAFDELVQKNVYSWTIMIGGYAQHSHAKDAMEIFNQMRQEGAQPNEITYLSILKACASPSALEWGKEVHVHIRHDELESDVRVGTALLKMYAKCGSIKEARQAFDRLTNRNVISWNVMIGAYAESGRGAEAYELFLQMKQEGFKPDVITYLSILNASASTGALEWVKKVHNHAYDARLESDLRVGSALVHMYAESGSMNDARLLFDRMKKRDVITWTTMIGAYAESGCGLEAYQLFLQMQREGCVPNTTTYVSILNGCASAGALEWVKEVHSHAIEAGLETDLRVGTALFHTYAKCGSIDDARLIFDRMQERDIATWNEMIGGLAQHGFGQEAYELFLQMQKEGFVPNAVTYRNILNPCAIARSLNWVKEVHRHAVEAGLESDLCV